jgi:hypothetical protein
VEPELWRVADSAPTEFHTPYIGIHVSQAVVWPVLVEPPASRTRPSSSATSPANMRPNAVEPVALQVPLAGSKISAEVV